VTSPWRRPAEPCGTREGGGDLTADVRGVRGNGTVRSSVVPVIQMTVVAHSSRPRFSSRGELEAASFAPGAGIDFLCGACDRVVLARVVPKFALEHSFPCPHCGALNEAP
jgi:hypothetical protein